MFCLWLHPGCQQASLSHPSLPPRICRTLGCFLCWQKSILLRGKLLTSKEKSYWHLGHAWKHFMSNWLPSELVSNYRIVIITISSTSRCWYHVVLAVECKCDCFNWTRCFNCCVPNVQHVNARFLSKNNNVPYYLFHQNNCTLIFNEERFTNYLKYERFLELIKSLIKILTCCSTVIALSCSC